MNCSDYKAYLRSQSLILRAFSGLNTSKSHIADLDDSMFLHHHEHGHWRFYSFIRWIKSSSEDVCKYSIYSKLLRPCLFKMNLRCTFQMFPCPDTPDSNERVIVSRAWRRADHLNQVGWCEETSVGPQGPRCRTHSAYNPYTLLLKSSIKLPLQNCKRHEMTKRTAAIISTQTKGELLKLRTCFIRRGDTHR